VIDIIRCVLSHLICSWQIVFVFVPRYETGGRYWFVVFPRVILAVLSSQILLIAYLFTQEYFVQGSVLIPLPVALFTFYRYCTRTYEPQARQLSLDYIRTLDSTVKGNETAYQRMIAVFREDAYSQPTLNTGPVHPEVLLNGSNESIEGYGIHTTTVEP
jgi:hypothetical protein